MRRSDDYVDAAIAQVAIFAVAFALLYVALWLAIIAFVVMQIINHDRRKRMRELARRDFDRRLIDANMHFEPDALLQSAFTGLRFRDQQAAGGVVFRDEDPHIPGISE